MNEMKGGAENAGPENAGPENEGPNVWFCIFMCFIIFGPPFSGPAFSVHPNESAMI